MDEEMKQKTVLIASVGGTPEPIASAMNFIKPNAIRFIVSSPEGGSESSRYMVEDLETVYFKDHKNPEKSTKGPGLRHLETCPEDMSIIEVPADSADRIFAECAKLISSIKASYPEHNIIVDYTGGTKSMAGGLLMAALGQDNVKVQVMTGKRENLEQVTKGTEAPHPMTTDYVLAARERSRIATLVKVYDYAAALDLSRRLLTSVERSKNRQLIKKSISETNLLKILVDWDNFDFAEAAKTARKSYENGGDAGEFLHSSGLLSPLCELDEKGKKQSTWGLCADLWLNAKRSAHRGRYDDATARLYRLTEAVLQAQLFEKYKLPNPVPWEKLPDELKGKTGQIRGKTYNYIGASLGLEKSIELIGYLNMDDDLYRLLVEDNAYKNMKEWLINRNYSILAHGFTRLNENNWNQASQWVESTLRPFWVKIEPPQLPQKLPE